MSRTPDDKEILLDISKKLNVLISLLLRSTHNSKATGKASKNIGATARYLAGMGLDAKDIAEIVDAPITSVRTLLTPSRRK